MDGGFHAGGLGGIGETNAPRTIIVIGWAMCCRLEGEWEWDQRRETYGEHFESDLFEDGRATTRRWLTIANCRLWNPFSAILSVWYNEHERQRINIWSPVSHVLRDPLFPGIKVVG